MKSGRVTLVSLDDWEGIYVDDMLAYQDFALFAGDVLRALEIDYEDIWEGEVEREKLTGRLPIKLKDLPLKVRKEDKQ